MLRNEYSPIRHLAMALGLSRWRDILMLNMTGYFDETGESSDINQRVNGMAGAIAPAEEWLSIESEWNDLLTKFNIPKFHTKKIRGKARKERQRILFLNLLEKIDALPLGWIVSMDVLNSMNPAERTRLELDEPYFQAFRYCINWSIKFAPINDKLTDPTAEEVVIFIDRKAQFYDKVLEYYEFWRLNEPLAQRVPANPVMRDSERYIPLQAADLIAGILKDEMERLMDRPTDEPQASFIQLQTMAQTNIKRPLEVFQHVPFCMLSTEDALYSKSGLIEEDEKMKKKIKTKEDGKGFERFDDLLRTVVKVPKDEILRREKEYKGKKVKYKQ